MSRSGVADRFSRGEVFCPVKVCKGHDTRCSCMVDLGMPERGWMLFEVANELRVGIVVAQGLWNLGENAGEPFAQESSISELGFVDIL